VTQRVVNLRTNKMKLRLWVRDKLAPNDFMPQDSRRRAGITTFLNC
jgi:hypothetical protein